MKLALLSLFVFWVSYSSYAQVGINTTDPDPSSILDIQAQNRGLLIPRIELTSTTDITTIDNPALSLLVYNLTSTADMTSGFYFWNGSLWQPFSGGSVSQNTWSIFGNDDITEENFLGTTNLAPLIFKIDNNQIGKFHAGGGMALGIGALTNPDNSVAIGNNAVANSGNQAIALGTEAKALGKRSASLGYRASASFQNGLAIGMQATSSAPDALSIGSDALASKESALSIGKSTRAEGINSTAIGYQSMSNKDNSLTFGNMAVADGEYAMAIGNNAFAQAYQSTVIGTASYATGEFGLAIGYDNTASGNNSAVFGSSSTASGIESMALGWNSSSTARYSIAIGKNVTANMNSTIIIGNSQPASFLLGSQIGIGTSSPMNGAKLDVDDDFKLGKKGTLHKGISSFVSEIKVSESSIIAIDIPLSAAPSSTVATVITTLTNSTANDGIDILWSRLESTDKLRIKVDFQGLTIPITTEIYVTIIEF